MMLRLSPRKADLAQLTTLMDSGDYATSEDLAVALWDKATELIQERAKWTVVGQLRYAKNGGYLTPDDARASKVCLGLFATEANAETAAAALRLSARTGEEWWAWVLSVEHASAGEVHSKRAKEHAEIIAGGTRKCSECGESYPDDAAGRACHIMAQGHQPTAA